MAKSREYTHSIRTHLIVWAILSTKANSTVSITNIAAREKLRENLFGVFVSAVLASMLRRCHLKFRRLSSALGFHCMCASAPSRAYGVSTEPVRCTISIHRRCTIYYVLRKFSSRRRRRRRRAALSTFLRPYSTERATERENHKRRWLLFPLFVHWAPLLWWWWWLLLLLLLIWRNGIFVFSIRCYFTFRTMKMCFLIQYIVIASTTHHRRTNDQINRKPPTQMSWQYAPQHRRKEWKKNNDSQTKAFEFIQAI